MQKETDIEDGKQGESLGAGAQKPKERHTEEPTAADGGSKEVLGQRLLD